MRKTEGSSKWVIVATLAIVVAAFLGSTGFAEYRAMRSHALTAEIATGHLAEHHAPGGGAGRAPRSAAAPQHPRPAGVDRSADVHRSIDGGARAVAREPAVLLLPTDASGRAGALAADRRRDGRRRRDRGTDPRADRGAALPGQRASCSSTRSRRRSRRSRRRSSTRSSSTPRGCARSPIGSLEQQRSRMVWVAGLDGLSVGLAVLLAWLALRTVTAQERLTSSDPRSWRASPGAWRTIP